MKNGIRRWLTLAIVPVATILMLGVAAPANADHKPPTHKCDNDINNPNPFLLNLPTASTKQNPFNGEIIVEMDGDCEVNVGDLYATLEIEFTVTNGDLKIQSQNFSSEDQFIRLIATTGNIDAIETKFFAASYVELEAGLQGTAPTGFIKTDDITSNMKDAQAGNNNIMVRANETVDLGDLKTNGELDENSFRSGAIQIDANLHPDNNGDLAIGGAAANVDSIDVRSKQGGGFDVELIENGVRITNGDTGSTGNMTVQVLSDIKVKNSESRAGRIELNTNSGKLTLAGGALDADGDMTNEHPAGSIYLFANEIEFLGDAIVTTSQHKNAPGVVHQIVLAAETINYTAGDLSILSNGDGFSDSLPGVIYVLPDGGMISESNNEVIGTQWSLEFNETFFEYDEPVHFMGGSESDLLIQANGQSTQIAITGNNIVFDGQNVQVEAKGGKFDAKHEIVMGFFDFDKHDGTKGLDINTTGKFEFFVRGEGQNASGGNIQIQVDKTEISSANFNLKANGPAGNNGDGGTILFTNTTSIAVGNDTKVKFDADASVGGTGNAQFARIVNGSPRQAIFFQAKDSVIPIGKLKKQYQFTANGGGIGGNGGAIEVTTERAIRIRNQENSISASAIGPTGNGGRIIIRSVKDNTSRPIKFIVPNANQNNMYRVAINATGAANGGNGGLVELRGESDESPTLPNGINVNAIIKVDGDQSTTNLGQFAGSIRINGVTCRQWKAGFPVYPKTYWACQNPDTPSADEVRIILGASVLHNNLKNQLVNTLPTLSADNRTVQIYAMDNVNTFFGYFAVKSTAQFTPDTGVYGLGINPYRVSAAFMRVFTGEQDPANRTLQAASAPLAPSKTGSPTITASTMNHELGHHFDFIWGTKSLDPTFITHQATGVQNLTGSTICTDAFTDLTCNDPTNAANWLTLNNFQVFQKPVPGGVPTLGYTPSNVEFFPYIFELIHSKRTGQFGAPPDLKEAMDTQFDDMEGFIDPFTTIPPAVLN